MRPALQERGLGDVAGQVTTLANAASSQPGWSEVAGTYESTREAIMRAMGNVSAAGRQSAGFQAKVLTAIVHQARHEYEEAVEDGRIAKPHEYRDSWSFMQVGRQLLEEHASAFQQADAEGYEQLVERYEAIMAAWPSVDLPDEPVSVSQLYGRVSAFEFVASRF